ncbi:MAG: DUF418 domain-containing protein [bacterium]|nr:DUF418 domain-containing protein [Acidimicrobiia bacterium]MCY4650304.1 DUF418 domain-containing protein [bacterium]
MSPLPEGPGRSRPIEVGLRNTNLDLVRGVAVLGILVMNVVSYGLGVGPYFNLSAGGSETWLDWAVGGFGEVFVDQKFMGLFSVLFGAGVALFCDRAAQKALRPALLSLWRNLLLLGIGFLHSLLWEGDILVVYALVSPIIILLRNRTPRTLFLLGGSVVLLSPLAAVLSQAAVLGDGSGLGAFMSASGEITATAEGFIAADFVARAAGMMLIGVGLYRNGVITGERSIRFYRRMAAIGLGTGLPMAALGLVWVVAEDFSPQVAFIGTIPNTLGTVPTVMGYASLIILWNRRPTSAHERLCSVGRLALTNYLTQTIIGVVLLRVMLADIIFTRTMLAAVVAAVWALQLWWSSAWLGHFRYGPAEWLWRVATYRRFQPLRRPASVNQATPRSEPG